MFGIQEYIETMDCPKRECDDIVDQAEWKCDNLPHPIEKIGRSSVDCPKRKCNEVEDKTEWVGDNPPYPRKEFTHLFVDRFRLILVLRWAERSCSPGGWQESAGSVKDCLDCWTC